MRRVGLILGVAVLAGCSVEQRSASSGATDISAAAAAAQGDIDTYAANTMELAAPKAALARPSPAVRPAGTESDEAPATEGSRVEIADLGDDVRPCVSGSATAGARTRVTTRTDEAEFERPDRGALQERATARVWRKGANPNIGVGRADDEPSATERPAADECTTN